MNQIATTERQPRSILVSMSERYGMEPAAFEATLRATVVPEKCSREQFAAFLLVAKEYDLNPILKEIYAFPSRGGGIQPIVSVDGWMNLINSRKELDGLEFDDHLAEDGNLTAITARIWRKDRAKPIVVTEYMVECLRDTDTWKKWPRRMLRHKAAIQCARYAFGFSGIVDPDEAERTGASEMRDVTPAKAPSPPAAPIKVAESYQGRTPPAKTPAHDAETGEVFDDESNLPEHMRSQHDMGASPEGEEIDQTDTAAEPEEHASEAPIHAGTVQESEEWRAEMLKVFAEPKITMRAIDRFEAERVLPNDPKKNRNIFPPDYGDVVKAVEAARKRVSKIA